MRNVLILKVASSGNLKFLPLSNRSPLIKITLPHAIHPPSLLMKTNAVLDNAGILRRVTHPHCPCTNSPVSDINHQEVINLQCPCKGRRTRPQPPASADCPPSPQPCCSPEGAPRGSKSLPPPGSPAPGSTCALGSWLRSPARAPLGVRLLPSLVLRIPLTPPPASQDGEPRQDKPREDEVLAVPLHLPPAAQAATRPAASP